MKDIHAGCTARKADYNTPSAAQVEQNRHDSQQGAGEAFDDRLRWRGARRHPLCSTTRGEEGGALADMTEKTGKDRGAVLMFWRV